MKRLGTLLRDHCSDILLWAGAAWQEKMRLSLPQPPPPTAAAGKFDMAIGIAGTTDYQSRGITQSDSDPAIQGYIEPSYGLGPVLGDAFVNVWSSSDVDFGGGVQGAEIDVAGGIKPKFLGPKWSPNIGYVHYFYAPEDLSPDYGEIYAKTDYTFGEDDKFTLRGLIFFAPDYNQSGFTGTWVAGGGQGKAMEESRRICRRRIPVLRRSKCLRTIRLDRRCFLLLEIAHVRRPLLGHKPERRRMRGSEWI